MFGCAGGLPFTEWKFKEGRDAGFNVFRFFALGNNNDDRNNPNRLNYALQPQPGMLRLVVLLLHCTLAQARTCKQSNCALRTINCLHGSYTMRTLTAVAGFCCAGQYNEV